MSGDDEMFTDRVVHALLPAAYVPSAIPRQFYGVVVEMYIDNSGVGAVLKVPDAGSPYGSGLPLWLGMSPKVDLQSGDFVIASYIGGRAVTFNRVERTETRTVVVHDDGSGALR